MYTVFAVQAGQHVRIKQTGSAREALTLMTAGNPFDRVYALDQSGAEVNVEELRRRGNLEA